MTFLKTKRPSGVITVHTSFPVSLLKSEDPMADVKETTGSSGSRASGRSKSGYLWVLSGKRHQVPSLCGPKNSHKQGRLAHTSLRQLQAKMETENQQVQELLRPLLVRENGFMKELESFLTQRDVTELRRRELRHKRWTERVWFPLQRRVEERVSSCNLMEAKRRQNVYGHLLRSCDLKFKTTVSEEMPGLQLHEKTGEKRASTSCQARSKNTCSKTQELPQTHRFFSTAGMSLADQLPQTLPDHLLPALSRIPEKDEAK
ncbi:protein FAM228A [Fundulus diaphanus]